MVLSMGAFAIADTFTKLSTSTLSSAQILLLLMGGGLISFTAIAKFQGEQLYDTQAFTPILLLRYFTEIVGLFGIVQALRYLPLSTVGAVIQASPLLIAIWAAFIFKEKVSWQYWLYISLGFAGVLLIIQPNNEGFDLSVLWAVVVLIARSVRDLTTSLIPKNIASTSIAINTMLVGIPFPVGWIIYNSEKLIPTEVNYVIVIPMIIFGSLGYILQIASIRMAKVSAVIFFSFSRVVFMTLLGSFVFHESLSSSMLFGATLIIVSCILIFKQEKK